jgi:hypothetical protein
VVDTTAKKLLEPIKGISGLRTDIVAGGDFVYLSTVDVRKPHALTLYAIDTEQDQVKVVLREIPEEYRFRLSYRDGLLYICRTAQDGAEDLIAIEVMDTGSATITARIDAQALSPADGITGRLFFSDEQAYVPCRLAGEAPGILRLSLSDLSPEAVFRTEGEVWNILGLWEDRLIFTGPDHTGKGGVSLVFYDTREEREVRRISIPEFLESKIRRN